MEIKPFKRKKKKDLLADTVDSLLYSPSESEFYFQISQLQRGGKGKQFKDFKKELPKGSYQEFEVNGPQDSRRIVIDMDTFEIFPTRDHYETMTHAGSPMF